MQGDDATGQTMTLYVARQYNTTRKVVVMLRTSKSDDAQLKAKMQQRAGRSPFTLLHLRLAQIDLPSFAEQMRNVIGHKSNGTAMQDNETARMPEAGTTEQVQTQLRDAR